MRNTLNCNQRFAHMYTLVMLYLYCATIQATTCVDADAEEGVECGHGDPVSTGVDAVIGRTANSSVDQV